VHTCDLDHPHAIGLYQKAGFVVYRQEIEVLRDPRLVGLPLPKRREQPTSTDDQNVSRIFSS
jgi:hypothetical protein